jgi:hypothetical protein
LVGREDIESVKIRRSNNSSVRCVNSYIIIGPSSRRV